MTRLWRLMILAGWLASTSGCAWLHRSDARAVRTSQYQSATILYQVPPRALGELAQAGKPLTLSDDCTVTLAIRYPHPDGRANYARAELVVESSPSSSRATAGWLSRMRTAAHEGLPGLAMDAGVEEVRGLDLRAAEFDALMTRIRQPRVALPPAHDVSVAIVAGQCNGVPMPEQLERVAELDALMLRLRREGAVLAHPTIPSEPQLVAQSAAAAAAATAQQRPPGAPVAR